MKKITKNLIALFGIICLIGTSSCDQSSNSKTRNYPIPTSGTMVKMDMEDTSQGPRRREWIERMHRTSENTDWREIEAERRWAKYQSKLKEFQNLKSNRLGKEQFANEKIEGQWSEIGSNNQAGSILEVEYNDESGELYALSAGGSIFKSKIFEDDIFIQPNVWKVVNDKLKFDPGFFELIKTRSGAARLLASVNKSPHYSDDDGVTWIAAASYNGDYWARYKNTIVGQSDNKNVILSIYKSSFYDNAKIIRSLDDGQSYDILRKINTYDFNNLALGINYEGTELYYLEQQSTSHSSISIYNFDNDELEKVQDRSGISFGEVGNANLQIITTKNNTQLYSFDEDNILRKSTNQGTSWSALQSFPTTPWDMGLRVSNVDPSIMIYGEVNAVRSDDGGQTWQTINEWYEYYTDVEGKLHADIMDIEEFDTKGGLNFMINANHGGLSISFDQGATHQNIGLSGLNVSQYYDVSSHPNDPNWVFAGTQDQGFQRANIANQQDTTYDFEQVISGDYGQTVFTNNGQNLWTVYPGGWVSFYENPTKGYLTDSWQLENAGSSVWIPPIVTNPHSLDDEVYLLGGNTTSGPGSFITHLLVNPNGGISAFKMPYDFDEDYTLPTAMAICPFDPDKWYVATENGNFYTSNDGGITMNLQEQNLPGSHYLYGSHILASQLVEGKVYLSGSGYNTAPVRISTDGGKSFEDMSDGLPSTLVFNLATNKEETILFAATESGPYMYVVEDQQWYDVAGLSAPAQTYWSVEFIDATNTARFGTYGRGAWDFSISEATSVTEIKNELNVYMYPNPVINHTLNIDFDPFEIQNGTMQIFNMDGQLMQQSNLKKSINVEQLSSGTYIMKIFNNKSTKNLKFVKI